jgi:hypothetical protein
LFPFPHRNANATTYAGSTHAAAPARAGGRTPISAHRSGTPNDTAVQALNGRVHELSQHLEGLEKERDFYFEKVCGCFCPFSSIAFLPLSGGFLPLLGCGQ